MIMVWYVEINGYGRSGEIIDNGKLRLPVKVDELLKIARAAG